jgi:hypothetical protein
MSDLRLLNLERLSSHTEFALRRCFKEYALAHLHSARTVAKYYILVEANGLFSDSKRRIFSSERQSVNANTSTMKLQEWHFTALLTAGVTASQRLGKESSTTTQVCSSPPVQSLQALPSESQGGGNASIAGCLDVSVEQRAHAVTMT